MNAQCVYLRLQHKFSVTSKTYQMSALAFRSRLRDELTWCRLSSTCPNSFVLVIKRKLLNKLLFWKFTSFMNHDVISSNLVHIVLTLHRSWVNTFLKVQKSPGSLAKNCHFVLFWSQILFGRYLWMERMKCVNVLVRIPNHFWEISKKLIWG